MRSKSCEKRNSTRQLCSDFLARKQSKRADKERVDKKLSDKKYLINRHFRNNNAAASHLARPKQPRRKAFACAPRERAFVGAFEALSALSL